MAGMSWKWGASPGPLRGLRPIPVAFSRLWAELAEAPGPGLLLGPLSLGAPQHAHWGLAGLLAS